MDVHVGLRLCCLHATMSGFTMRAKHVKWLMSRGNVCLIRAQGYKKKPCSTQLSTKLIMLLKNKILSFQCLKQSEVVFIMLINLKMPTIVGILFVRN